LLLNAHYHPVDFTLPPALQGCLWKSILNTSRLSNPFKSSPARKRIKLSGRSLILLCEQQLKTRASL